MTPPVPVIVKIGGGLLAVRGALDVVAAALATPAARAIAPLIVPGGGPFADAVRNVEDAVSVDADAAHWMAILGMEQYAHLLASRIPFAHLVERLDEIPAVRGAHGIPVLAPYRLLRHHDPLPHSWSVTSDSVAAWVSGVLDARRLILVKPVRITDQSTAVDRWFASAIPDHVVVAMTDAAGLSEALPEP